MSKAANKDATMIFRLSLHDRKSVIAKARKAGLSASDFCRRAVLDKKITHIDGLPKLNNDLSHIGNNLNQIAIATHQGRDASSAIMAMQSRYYRTFDKIDYVLDGGDGDSDSQTD